MNKIKHKYQNKTNKPVSIENKRIGKGGGNNDLYLQASFAISVNKFKILRYKKTNT
jgi:hypothetical protein